MTSVRRQLIVQTLLPVSLLLGGLFWMMFDAIDELLAARLEKEIELVARSLRGPVEGALRERDPVRLGEALGAVAQIGRVYGAAVYDADGRRIAVAGDAMPGRSEQLQAVELVELGQERGQYADFGGSAVYSYFVPLSVSLGRIDGLLQVVRQESDIRQRLDAVRQRGLVLVVVGIALILGVLLIGHQRVLLRPVRSLLETMREVERGDRQRRAGLTGPRELARLGEALNRMLDARDRAEAEVIQHRREQEALSVQLQRKEAEAALGRFSAGVAHELGAPLTVIQTDVRRLRERVDSSDAIRRLDRIREQLERTRQLVEQLMSLVRERPDAGVVFDPVEALRRAVGAARLEAESRGIDLELEAQQGAKLRGFEVRVEHAVLNLVRNALEAAASTVCVRLRQGADRIDIVVEDDGPGVDPALGQEVFRPFVTRRGQDGGTGLGLTIVRTVAEIHGGAVRFGRSGGLGGGRFELSLPREPS